MHHALAQTHDLVIEEKTAAWYHHPPPSNVGVLSPGQNELHMDYFSASPEVAASP
jgi:hypothetical protein